MHENRIRSVAELRALYGEPVQRAIEKVVDRFLPAHRQFIARSPFLVMSSQGAAGADVSPRGDRPGFVHILDDTTLAIPDRPGNRRVDTLQNVLDDPRVALIFFVPGVNETMRVNGTAYISVEPKLLQRLAHEGTPAICALVVEAHEVFHQCVRALRRAELWNPATFAGAEFPRISRTPESAYDGNLY